MTVVETRCGKVEGVEKGGVLQFRGVPYAAPPVGDLRWQAPRTCEPWTGVRPATEFSPMAPQSTDRISLLPAPERMDQSEDCLYLNVFTTGAGAEPRPVMVWIH